MNSFGNQFRLTTFGESHSPAVGGVIDGCPAGIVIDQAFINSELRRTTTSLPTNCVAAAKATEAHHKASPHGTKTTKWNGSAA